MRYIIRRYGYPCAIVLVLLTFVAGCAGLDSSLPSADRSMPSQKTREKKTQAKPRTPLSVRDKAANPIRQPDKNSAYPVTEEKNQPAVKTEKALSSAPRLTDNLSEPHRPSPEKSRPTFSLKPVYSATSEHPSDNTDPPNMVFNFDNADLYEVIRTMAELLEINYIVDPNVRGTVTIHTAGKLRKRDLFPLFFQILEANGLTAVKEGDLYRVNRIKEASRMSIPIYKTDRDTDVGKLLAPGEHLIMQIIPLRHISPQEMTKLLTPFISAEGTIISHDDSKTLLLVDKADVVNRALRLVDIFDVDTAPELTQHFRPLKYIDAKEAAKILEEIMFVYTSDEKDAFKIIALERLNTLLIMTKQPGLIEGMDKMIARLDVPGDSVEPRIYVYSVKNGEAKELSALLGSVFTGTTAPPEAESKTGTEKEDADKIVSGSTPFGKKAEKKSPKPSTPAFEETLGSGTLKGEVNITADEIRNALIIEAIPSDYRIIENLLKKIDILPRQVLIEVVIAEISLDTLTDLGLEWHYSKGEGSMDTSLLSADITSSGLQYVIGQANRWTHTLSALATENKVNLISSPTVLASDNKEAKISVATQIPVASAEYRYDAGNEGVTQTNIQYRDTGVILSVKPHINERGLVSMEINQEVSESGGGVDVGGKVYPSFRQRSVTTTLTVKHGQTIVIGGLITEKDEGGKGGVPFLSDIPILGYLFGKTKNEFNKTELVLLITPRVIVNLEEIDAVTEDFKNKVTNARKKLE